MAAFVGSSFARHEPSAWPVEISVPSVEKRYYVNRNRRVKNIIRRPCAKPNFPPTPRSPLDGALPCPATPARRRLRACWPYGQPAGIPHPSVRRWTDLGRRSTSSPRRGHESTRRSSAQRKTSSLSEGRGRPRSLGAGEGVPSPLQSTGPAKLLLPPRHSLGTPASMSPAPSRCGDPKPTALFPAPPNPGTLSDFFSPIDTSAGTMHFFFRGAKNEALANQHHHAGSRSVHPSARLLSPTLCLLDSFQWRSKGEEAREIVENQLGWDITDFGGGHFDTLGLFLFTVRNGSQEEMRARRGKLLLREVDGGGSGSGHAHALPLE